MARLIYPPPSARLVTTRIATGTVWHHLFLDRFADPLGSGYAPSRFSDPRRRARDRFGVYYVGATFEVAFLETIVRDARNRNAGTLLILSDELDRYAYVEIVVEKPLTVVDLRRGSAIIMGIPTDAARARSHQHGRRASRAFYCHPDMPDGIRYALRLNEDENLASTIARFGSSELGGNADWFGAPSWRRSWTAIASPSSE